MDLVKKARERDSLERFRRAYPAFPAGAIEDSESPDFLVHAPDGTVGIEMVDYVREQGGRGGSSALRREALGARIAAEASRVWAARGGDPVHVWFSFGLYALPKKASVPALARSLADIVSRHIPSAGPGETELDAAPLAGTILEGVVNRVRILHWPGGKRSYWMYLPDASFVSVGREELQTLIDGKGAQVDAYLGKCHSVWLLIVALWGSSLARTGTPSGDVHGHIYRCRFRRVFFFNMEAESVLELK